MSKQILDRHKALWEKKQLTRYLYTKWFREIQGELSEKNPSIEIGAGTGNFKEFMPSCLASDVVPCEWLDIVHDAMRLPYADSSVGNFILIDAIHHIQNPVKALTEMERCLKKGGRIIIFDVFISPFSYIYYNYLHKEEVDLSEDLFKYKEETAKEPFDSNQAIATLLFFRQYKRLETALPSLKMTKRETKEFLLYPLSGGFEGRQLIPFGLKNFAEQVDRVGIKIFGDKVAARCLVVLEKTV